MKSNLPVLVLSLVILGSGPVARAQQTEDTAPAENDAARAAGQTGDGDNESPEQADNGDAGDEAETQEPTAGCDCPNEATPAPPPILPETGFIGEGGLGWIVNSGNTNNQSLNGNLAVKYIQGPWQYGLTFSAKRVEEENATTAERYLFTGKTDYDYADDGYAFVAVRYDDDRFDGFDYQTSLSTGLGWRIINSDGHHLDTEFGFGYRRNQPATTATTPPDTEPTEEIIGRFAEHYDVRLTDSTQLTQDLLVESGNSNTTSEFALALKVDMNDSIALQVSYNVKHNSDPPPSGDPADPTENTDRTTRVTLVFGF